MAVSLIEVKFNKILDSINIQLNTPYNKFNTKYQEKISENEHHAIFSFILDKLKNAPEIKEEIINKQEVRFSKEKFKDLPRNIQIIKNYDGELLVIIEAENLVAGGSADRPNKFPSGAFKKCYPAFVVPPVSENQKIMGDSGYQYVALVSNISELFTNDKILSIEAYKNSIQKEAELSLVTDGTVKLISTSFNENGREINICYAKKGVTLDLLIKDDSNYKKLEPKDKLEIFFGLIEALFHLHKLDITHQDLKLGNIVAFYNSKNKPVDAKLTDLGVCSELWVNKSGKKMAAIAPAGYESPEMNKGGFLNKHYKVNQQKTGEFRTIASCTFDNNSISDTDQEINPKNDMWALGIIYLFLFYKPQLSKTITYVDNIEKGGISLNELRNLILNSNDIWIRGLLNPNRESRFSSEDAKSAMSKICSSPINSLNSFRLYQFNNKFNSSNDSEDNQENIVNTSNKKVKLIA